MGAFLASLVAALKGVSAAKALIDQFVEAWITYKSVQIDEKYDKLKAKREMLTYALKNAPDDEARKQAARELYRLNAGR